MQRAHEAHFFAKRCEMWKGTHLRNKIWKHNLQTLCRFWKAANEMSTKRESSGCTASRLYLVSPPVCSRCALVFILFHAIHTIWIWIPPRAGSKEAARAANKRKTRAFRCKLNFFCAPRAQEIVKIALRPQQTHDGVGRRTYKGYKLTRWHLT